MKKLSILIKTLSLLCVLAFSLEAQTTTSSSSRRINKIQDAKQLEFQVQQVIDKAESYFREGELKVIDGRLSQAWDSFDESIETILYSTINIKTASKLENYYFQLIDRIYKVEMAAKKRTIQAEKLNFAISPKCLEKPTDNKEINELLSKAIDSYKQGKNEEVLIILRRVLISNPMSAEAYLVLGKIHLRNGDIEQSISSMKTALFWDNQLVEAHILLGKIYFERGNVLQAKNYSASALVIDSNNKRAQSLPRLIEGRASSEDKKAIEDDSTEIENLLQKLREIVVVNDKNNYSDVVFVAPFQSIDNNTLSGDFAHVLSEVLIAPNLCAVRNEEREKILENFGFDIDETFTLATSIKFAIVSKASLLIVGQYERKFDYIATTTKIIRVNEGRFLSEEFPDGRRIIRDIIVKDSFSNLRKLQGQIAYQILYQRDKAIPFTQNQFIETTSKIKLPNSLNPDRNSTNEPDFSTNNSLRKTICDENVLETLQLRNFRLGITFDDAARMLPKATIKNVSSYQKQIYQNFSIATLKDGRFKDINSIQLRFFDNHLYSIEIVYDDNIKWQNLNEFSSQVEKSLNLPMMKNGGYEFDGKYLYCGNYQIKVMFAKYKIPAIHLFDTTVFDKIEQKKKEEKNKILQQKVEEEKRKRQIEEEKKKVFKP